MDRWAVRHKLDDEQFAELVCMLRSADHEFLKIHNPPPEDDASGR